MKRQDFRYLERLRVRWAEVDMQHIVFNGHYLTYVDTAVAGYWRAMAIPYQATMSALQGDLYVRKATLEYLGSARYDEQLEVGVRCQRIGNSSLVLQAAVLRSGQCLVHGELVYVYADPLTQTSKPLDPGLRETLTAFEAGQSMLKVELGDWATVQAAATPLRKAVFHQEQQIGADLIFDAADAQALHAVVYNRLGWVVGSGRAVFDEPAQARLGRMATHAAVRGAGVGRSLLAALAQAASERGATQLTLHAQASAVGFYRRLGFEAVGASFEEAGIEHQAMRRSN